MDSLHIYPSSSFSLGPLRTDAEVLAFEAQKAWLKKAVYGNEKNHRVSTFIRIQRNQNEK